MLICVSKVYGCCHAVGAELSNCDISYTHHLQSLREHLLTLDPDARERIVGEFPRVFWQSGKRPVEFVRPSSFTRCVQAWTSPDDPGPGQREAVGSGGPLTGFVPGTRWPHCQLEMPSSCEPRNQGYRAVSRLRGL